MSNRPIECSACKRKIKVLYKEIVGKTVTTTEMCEECPVLKAKLQGDAPVVHSKKNVLCCDRCGTTLEEVLTGQPLGCAECYTVFAEFIVQELVAVDGIPAQSKQKPQILHIGRSPEQTRSLALSSKLASLHEALNEALKQENYEQAAYLRDQIKSITEKS